MSSKSKVKGARTAPHKIGLRRPSLMQDNLEALLRAVGLQRFAPQFADEELTAKLLRTMTPTILLTSLSELGLSPQECASLAEHEHARPNKKRRQPTRRRW